MKKLSIIITFFTVLIGCEKATTKKTDNNNIDYYERCRLLVLQENNPNQDYEFSKMGKEIDQQVIKYLGSVYTSKKDTLKILSNINYTGLYEDAKRGSGSVYIYNNNKLVGFYYVGSALAVPNKIENNKDLIFDYKNDVCNQTTKVSLNDSIPKRIFIQCTKDGGDLYNFKTTNNTTNNTTN
ncbi:hypothetical protein [Chryseobacterium carnipullorum]|nr:hypothetical protein [Chryseobacterium carnipullorum]